jgi:glycosyltransferase involved in cell wall biosynthesis
MLKAYNRQSLNTFIEDRKIDVVINGTHHFFFLGDSKKYKHIFDLNDLPVLENVSACGKYIYEFTRRQAQGSDVVTACSHGLVDYAAREFGVKAEFIPNGVDLKDFSRDNSLAVERLRAKYGLSGKTVLGYIGRIGEWMDLGFTINFFLELKKRRPDIALLIVGEGLGLQRIRIEHPDIIFTGEVPSSEVGAYFSLLDIGLLPSVKNLFQDVAFHIKLIEYTAAGKMVISSPLEEVKRLGFPNILIAELSLDKWNAAFDSALKTRWKSEWNQLVKGYDWQDIAARFQPFIEG